MRFSELSEWLSWLETCHPQAIELGLDRIRTVAQNLFPQWPSVFPLSKVVTIGGTNGKGSCVAFLDHILRAADYRVACYTSPHLLHYNERCVIDGKPVSDAALVEAFAAVDQARQEISLTYFEFGTLAALWLFAQAKPDVVLLEVGLGGRLDAVNIVDADISIVSSVDIDHADWLGNDREGIATEKAGIFRAGRPALSGDVHPPHNLKKVAQDIGAQWYGRDEQFTYRVDGDVWFWSGLDAQGLPIHWDNLPLPQLSLTNAALVLQALPLLGLSVKEAAIHEGLCSAQVVGRFSQLRVQQKAVIFDVAHNPAAARLLAHHLALSGDAQNTVAIFAVMADKDIDGIVEPLLSSFAHWYVLPLKDVPRAMTPDALFNQLHAKGLSVEALPNGKGVQSVMAGLRSEQRVVVFGSFFTVAAVMQELGLDTLSTWEQ